MHSQRASSDDHLLHNVETLRRREPTAKIIQHDFNPGRVLSLPTKFGRVEVAKRIPPEHRDTWARGLAHLVNDHRYYEITQAHLHGQFRHYYLFLRDHERRLRVIQPILVAEQDIAAGLPNIFRQLVARTIGSVSFSSKMRILMVGCSAGEGHLANDIHKGETSWKINALAESLPVVAKALAASMIVFKDFPKSYREQLTALQGHGYTRIPSMPGSKLDLNFTSFENYLQTKLSPKTRKNLRSKLRKAAKVLPVHMEVRTDISSHVDELLPLYQQVLKRSQYRFEELTRDYFVELGQKMSDRAIYFIWRHKGRAVAFCSCLRHNGVLRDNYIGLDYAVAHQGHLYFVTMRDMITWALINGYRTYYSAPLNYEPKYHLRHDLVPLDLHVRATSKWLNPFLRMALPFLEPTRYDPFIQKFTNAADLR